MHTDDMSEGEYEYQYALCADGDWDVEIVPKRTHWTTRGGERIAIRDLSDSHLANILAMLLRKHTHRWSERELRLAEQSGSMDARVWVAREWPELVEEMEKRGKR